jgi:hypothetical protein
MNSEFRNEIYRWLRRSLIGPANPIGSGTDSYTLNRIRPLERFQTGILFPVSVGESGLDAAEPETDEEEAGLGEEDKAGAEASSLSRPRRRVVPPSSVGFSFFVHGASIEIQLIPRAVGYQRAEERTPEGHFTAESWHRVPLGRNDDDAWTLQAPDRGSVHRWREQVFDSRAELLVLWRPHADGWLVTVSLSNSQEVGGQGQDRGVKSDLRAQNERALLEVELECFVHKGAVGPYPRADFHLLSDEEQELELRYRNQIIYAIGHGAAVDWTLDGSRVVNIRTEFLPKVEVPRVDPDAGKAGGTVLEVERLATIASERDEVCDALDRFVAGYAAWIEGQARSIEDLDTRYHRAAEEIVSRMRTAAKRMQAGADLLREEDTAARAFGLANEAMASQMRQSLRQCRPMGKLPGAPCWRPFQLAFLLLAIQSAIDEDAEDRDLLDLIWFPTGGGKTEAYLGLMAFVIWWRRLGYKASGGGTAVLMRYTLRLLTKDQFRRAARLICAMELMRRKQPQALGAELVTLGLWVGGASSPNTFEDARQVLRDAKSDGQGRPPSLLVLESCPWCGSAFTAADNFDAGAQHFHFRCTSSECDFGSAQGGTLPCNVVDAALYDSPPTLLLATIDKFARLAWEERTSVFFGRGGNRPPELIIQDELHLISSALGSVAGLYEAGLETVLRMRGMYPKYIASTATIRMAREQVERLYGRQAAVFPPPGLSADDSYFARTIAPTEKRPGRLYVGYLAPARNRQRCLAPLAAALLSAPEALFGDASSDRDAQLDAWWTLLVYHGSLKGVGVSRNALREIEEGIDLLRREWQEQRSRSGTDAVRADEPAARSARWRDQLADRVTQLTSHMSADENARSFERLGRPRGDPDALDLALATNMISVGLDVTRLAVMVINGQPLTTAEYIQASSRVGRGAVPGLVVANYYRDQARSLSHYESFRAYHEAFYRFVEPTSVTPYTYQARLRALHAALVIAVRHSSDELTANARARAFDPTRPETARLIEVLTRRCREADPQRGDETAAHIHRLVEQWAEAARRAAEQKQGLVYSGSERDRRAMRLLYSHEDRCKGEWPTLHNMRNVENLGLVKIL